MSVNVVKTCEFLQAPTEPMALRMSSSLMIGVTRVYARQYQHLLGQFAIRPSFPSSFRTD